MKYFLHRWGLYLYIVVLLTLMAIPTIIEDWSDLLH